MHAFARRLHQPSHPTTPTATRGLVLNMGWRYDLMEWVFDTCLFHGRLRELRERTADLADLHAGDRVLDVGCGTGTLALIAQARVGPGGRVVGIDPGREQVARASAKAARRSLPAVFEVATVEHLPFDSQTFDVAFSTIMLHHLPPELRRQGLLEVARVLKPTGRLVVADFRDAAGKKSALPRCGLRHGGVRDLPELVCAAGLAEVRTEELMLPARFGHPSAVVLVSARKRY
jgi:ubiquinone/menaquinone biosynthesis C-methylase UbiE